jgi:hypothetical protein
MRLITQSIRHEEREEHVEGSEARADGGAKLPTGDAARLARGEVVPQILNQTEVTDTAGIQPDRERRRGSDSGQALFVKLFRGEREPQRSIHAHCTRWMKADVATENGGSAGLLVETRPSGFARPGTNPLLAFGRIARDESLACSLGRWAWACPAPWLCRICSRLERSFARARPQIR